MGTVVFATFSVSVKNGVLTLSEIIFTRLVKAGFRERFGDHSVTPPQKPSI
jgi:hypothetical protein